MRRLVLLAAASVAALVTWSGPAEASPYVRYGLQDDAWLRWGPGTLESRLDRLDAMGVELVRFTVRWDEVEASRGARDWSGVDPVLVGLHARGIAPLVTLYGTPRWANGGRSPNWAPERAASFAGFAGAAARRYPFVRSWLIWNEPNQRRWLRPTAATTYVTKLLNPGRAAIRGAVPAAKVAGGATAPRGGPGGVSPVRWIRGRKAAGARLDAYAHHPYPLTRFETPSAGGCGHCETITMATLERLLREVSSAWGAKRIWLTESGYQTNPPDRGLGVSPALQARYLADAARRAHAASRVDVLIHYLVKDEPSTDRWQSGLFTSGGSAKPSLAAMSVPLAQVSRTGLRTVVWGQVRPGSGPQRYVLQQRRGGFWHAVGGVRVTTPRGYLSRSLRAGRGAQLRLWHPASGTAGPALAVR